MSALKNFEDLRGLLSGTNPLPDSRFISYSLPLNQMQLAEIEPLLKENTTLKGLRLRNCGIGDLGAEVLQRVLAFNSTLEKLELPGNQITNQGAMFLANALRTFNFTLMSLDLQDNPCLVDDVVMMEIAEFLGRNNSQLASSKSSTPRLSRSPYKIQEVHDSLELSNAVHLENRLLRVENDLEAHAEELEGLKAIGLDLSGWRSQLDCASGQMAAVLEMLKHEIDELRERMNASEHSSTKHTGPEVASLAAQFRTKHEELQQSLNRLHGSVTSSHGAHESHMLLADAVEHLTKRIEALDHTDASNNELLSSMSSLRQHAEDLEAQLMQLQGQQEELKSSTASATKLAQLQGQLVETMALAPQVEHAITGVENLQQLVMGLSEEVSSSSVAASATSSNVAALARKVAELEAKVEQGKEGRHELKSAIKRLAGQIAADSAATKTLDTSVKSLETGHGKLQEEVGKLHLAVSVVEQALDGINPSERLAEHQGMLEQLQTEQQGLKDGLAENCAAHEAWSRQVADRLIGAEAEVQRVQQAVDNLQTTSEQHPAQWGKEMSSLVAPLQAELQELQAKLASNCNDLRAALEKQPQQWTADMQTTLQPLLHQLSLQEEAARTACSEAQGIMVKVGSLEASMEVLRDTVADHPVQWTAALESASEALRVQISELKASHTARSNDLQVLERSAAALETSMISAQTAFESVKASVEGQPSVWRQDFDSKTAPLQQGLESTIQSTTRLQGELAGLKNRMDEVEAVVSKVEAAADCKGLNAALQAELQAQVDGAVHPIQLAVNSSHQQQQVVAQTVERLFGDVELAKSELEKVADKAEEIEIGLGSWKKEMQGTVSELNQKVATVQKEQDTAGDQMHDLESALDSLASKVNRSLDEVHAELELLQGRIGEHPAMWDKAVTAEVQPLKSKLAEVAGKQDSASKQVSGLRNAVGSLSSQVASTKEDIQALQNASHEAREAICQVTEPLQAELGAVRKEQQKAADSLCEVQARAGQAECVAEATSAAVKMLQETVAQHPGMWNTAVTEATYPLAAKVESLEQQRDASGQHIQQIEQQLSTLAETIRTAGAAVQGLQLTLSSQPWVPAVEGLDEKVGYLQGKQEVAASTLNNVQLTLETLQQSSGAAARAVEQLQAAFDTKPWQSAVEEAVHPLTQQLARAQHNTGAELGSLGARLDSLQSNLCSAESSIQVLQNTLKEQHDASAVSKAGLESSLAEVATKLAEVEESVLMLQNAGQQHHAGVIEEHRSMLTRMQQDVTASTTKLDGMDSRLDQLQTEMLTQPEMWEAAAQAAVMPVQQELETLGKQHVTVAQTVDDLGARVAEIDITHSSTAGLLATLHDQVLQQQPQWEEAVSAQAGPLKAQLASLEEQHGQATETISEVQTGLAWLVTRVDCWDESVGKVQAQLAQHPVQWEAAICSASSPLQSRLETVEGQQSAAAEVLDRVAAAVASLEARGVEAEVTLRSMAEALEDQAGQAQVSIKDATAPMQLELQAISQKQECTEQTLNQVQEEVTSLAAAAGEASSVLNLLQQQVGQQSVRWDATVQAVFEPLERQIAALVQQQGTSVETARKLQETVSGMAHGTAAVGASLAAVDKQVQQQPAEWQSSICTATKPLKQQLAVLAKQHSASTVQLAGVEEEVGSVRCVATEAQSAVEALQLQVEQHPAEWQAAIKDEVSPLKEQLAGLSEQQQAVSCAVGKVQEGLASVMASTSVVEERLKGLSQELRGQPEEWMVTLADAVSPLEDRVHTLEGKQSDAASGLQGVQSALHKLRHQHQQLELQVVSTQEQLAGAASQQSLSELQQGVSEQQAAVMQQIHGIQASLDALPLPYDDAALVSRVVSVEAAVGVLHTGLSDLQAATATLQGSAAAAAETATQHLRAQQAELVRQITAVQNQLRGVEAASCLAAEGSSADRRELQQLAAAMERLAASQAELDSAMHGMGQEQLELAHKVDALPTLLLAERSERDLASPLSTVPQLSLRSLTPTSAAATHLESHPLLTARTWYEDPSEELETPNEDLDELVELRATMAVQTKQTIHLESKVVEQAQQIERLESQLQEMRFIMSTLTGSGQLLASTPMSATQAFMRRSLTDRPTPLSAARHTPFFDACSEAGDTTDDDALYSTVPVLAAPQLARRLSGSGKPPGEGGSGGAPLTPSVSLSPLSADPLLNPVATPRSTGQAAHSSLVETGGAAAGAQSSAAPQDSAVSLDGGQSKSVAPSSSCRSRRRTPPAGGAGSRRSQENACNVERGRAVELRGLGELQQAQQGVGLTDVTNRRPTRGGKVAAAVAAFGVVKDQGLGLNGPGERRRSPAMKPAAH